MPLIRIRLERLRRPAIFGLSAALSRAGGILSVPIAAQALSLRDLGYYAICVALIQILCQFLSLGGTVAVAKTGAENVARAHALAVRFSLVAISSGTMVSFIGFASGPELRTLIGLVTMISALEAHQQLYQLVIRAREQEILFFFVSTLKAFMWPACVLVYIFGLHQGQTDISIASLLTLQLATYAFVSVVFLVAAGHGLGSSMTQRDGFLTSIKLSLPMVLHSFAQWIMSSADRIFLGKLTDSETLAFYSLAYSLASLMFVIVSGMALYLPHEIMKRVSHWGDPIFRLRFVRLYAIAYFACFTLLVLAYVFDYFVTNLLRYRNPDMFLVLGFAGTGFLFTGVYHLYVPFLFAAGRTDLVTKQTLRACLIYTIVALPLIYLLSAVGAAIATMIVWIYYMISIRSHAVTYLAGRGIGDYNRTIELGTILTTSIACCALAATAWTASSM